MPAATEPVRSLTIESARRTRIVLDLVRDIARVRPAGWWVGATVVVTVALGVAGDVWWAGLALLLGVASVQLVAWWVAAARGTGHGLGVGDTLSVRYTADGLLAVSGPRGDFMLSRGSVRQVRRTGRNATVFGRSVTMILPGELLDDRDVAFLEGHADPVVLPSEKPSASALPLRVQVTDTIQGQLVSAATRWILTTADFLLPFFAAGCFAALATVTGVWGLLWVSAVLLATALPGILQVAKMRAGLREIYPVGRTVAARVTPEELTLALRHGTWTTDWSAFEAVKATDAVVLLRHRRRRFGRATVQVLPLALFGAADIRVIAAAVPRRF